MLPRCLLSTQHSLFQLCRLLTARGRVPLLELPLASTKAVKEGPLLTLLRRCVLSRGLGPLSQQSQALKGELSLGPGARSFCWFPLCQKMPWNPGPGPLPWRTWFYFLICTGKVGPVTPPDPQVSTRTDQLAFKSLQLEAQGSVHRGLHAESTSLLLLVLP